MQTYKLGKLPATRDIRTIRFQDILKAVPLPPIPDKFDVDQALNFKPVESDFGNLKDGNCVTAFEFNMLMRHQYVQQKIQVPVDTNTCLNLYWREQGWNGCWLTPKPDNGLNMLNSLNYWRQNGITIAGKNYKIYAFANLPCPNGSAGAPPDILAHDDELLFQAIYFLYGVGMGVALPLTAQTEFANGQPWADVSTKLSQIDGGHAVYVKGYDKTTNPQTLKCITWGKEQLLTLDWLHEYVDELYPVIAAKDSFVQNDVYDENELDQEMTEITGGA